MVIYSKGMPPHSIHAVHSNTAVLVILYTTRFSLLKKTARSPPTSFRKNNIQSFHLWSIINNNDFSSLTYKSSNMLLNTIMLAIVCEERIQWSTNILASLPISLKKHPTIGQLIDFYSHPELPPQFDVALSSYYNSSDFSLLIMMITYLLWMLTFPSMKTHPMLKLLSL